MRRPFAAALLAFLCAIVILPLSPGQVPSTTGATAIPDHVALTWTGDPETTMTITWRTDPTVMSGMVEFQKGGKITGKSVKAQAVAREFVTDLGPTRLFTATLTGLSPKTKYSYRVGDGRNWSEPSFFTTARRKARSFKFLIFGDSQSAVGGPEPYGLWRRTVQNAYAANRDAKFMVNVGDLVDYGQLGAHWNAWFAAAKGVVDRIPEMAVSGNHEYFGSKNMTQAAFFNAQWALPQNGPEGVKGRAYSYDYGPVHFVVLDSQSDEQKAHGDILKTQREWLEADLAASKAIWKIVFFHKPPYTIYPRRRNDAVKGAFCPVLEKHRVDLVFNAHDHGIARTYPINADRLMRRPSEGVIYYISGQTGGKTYKAVQKMEYHTFFHNPVEQPNYFVMDVTEKKITVNTILQNGTVLDVFFIDKKKDVSSDMLREPGSSGPRELKPAA